MIELIRRGIENGYRSIRAIDAPGRNDNIEERTRRASKVTFCTVISVCGALMPVLYYYNRFGTSEMLSVSANFVTGAFLASVESRSTPLPRRPIEVLSGSLSRENIGNIALSILAGYVARYFSSGTVPIELTLASGAILSTATCIGSRWLFNALRFY